jgi:hypothetical protein
VPFNIPGWNAMKSPSIGFGLSGRNHEKSRDILYPNDARPRSVRPLLLRYQNQNGAEALAPPDYHDRLISTLSK